MANNLTGDYEAVLQVSVRQINGLLATLHQNGGEPGKSPHFPHRSVNMRVGGDPKILDLGVVHFSKWLGDAVQKLRASGPSFSSSASPLEIGAHLAAKAPPGAAVRLHKALEDLDAARVEVVPSGTVRGFADVQISTPAISLVRSEVVVHVYVRAHYYPEGGTPALPEPIHGEVRIMYQLVPKTVNGKNVLEVQVPSDDSRIQFFPAPGSGPSQADAESKITVHIRKAVREGFKPTAVDLPGDFKYFEFKALGSFGNLLDHHYVDALGTGDEQALALPMQLSGDPAPPGAIDSVTNLFLGTGPSQSDFAIAVSKEYVKTKFQPTLDKLRQIRKSFEVQTPWYLPTPTYCFSVTGVDLQFKFGSIDLIINAKATTRYIGFPNYDPIGITQRLTLALIGQSVMLQASDSDLTITGITGPFSGQANSRAKAEIIAERDKALPAAQAALNDALQKAVSQLNSALKSFDDSASASYTAVEINPDGIIVRGAIETKYHYDPEMHIDYTADGNFWTALNCWIRGGRIDQFTWTYVLATHPVAWFNKATHATVYHRFTYPIPDALKGNLAQFKQVCLTIEGTQVTANGNTVAVKGEVASGTCSVSSHEPILVMDSITEAIYVALHRPEPPAPDGVLEEATGGHVNILAAHPLPPGGVTTNSLIHFAGARAERPLEALNRALAQIRRRDFALTFVVVMPRGAFANSRREVEERLGLLEERGQRIASERTDEDRPESREERFPVPLVITEDYVEGWTRTFGVTETPASYLVNARGEFVWKQEGRLDPDRLAAALDEHLLPSQQRPPLPLRLTVQPGEPAPDATFADEQGQVLALRRLRGRSALLLFWQSWSAPCIRELRRLQRLHEEGGGRAPVILAVNGGEDRTVLAEVRHQHNLTFTLIHDAGQRIARLYGVACWPTTVSINPDGILDRIQFGITHEHRSTREGKEREAS